VGLDLHVCRRNNAVFAQLHPELEPRTERVAREAQVAIRSEQLLTGLADPRLQMALRGAERRIAEAPELAARISQLATERGKVIPCLDLLFVVDALFLQIRCIGDHRLADVVAGQCKDATTDLT